MQFFYDGTIRRYISQTIRFFSNFTVQYGDGSIVKVPAMYGDVDRQVANIINQNSENTIQSAPKISLYITNLDLDMTRMRDRTFVDSKHFVEREKDTNNNYTTNKGRNYTVERIMPTPYLLSMKVDIWTTSTEQKLQLLEQILIFFNPDFDIQISDNYVDWTSLTRISLKHVSWSSRTIPVGTDSPIDIASLELEIPIFLTAPCKVKNLGVITNIITNIFDDNIDLVNHLGNNLSESLTNILNQKRITISNYILTISNNTGKIMDNNGNIVHWTPLLNEYPDKYIAGNSRLILTQKNNLSVMGRITVNNLDDTIINIQFDSTYIMPNIGIDSNGHLETDTNYNLSTCNRPNSPGTFDNFINPLEFHPSNIIIGTRYILTHNLGSKNNTTIGWGSLVAHSDDIIEWDGSQWNVIFESDLEHDTLLWQTDITNNKQYEWNGIEWNIVIDGVYSIGKWRLEL